MSTLEVKLHWAILTLKSVEHRLHDDYNEADVRKARLDLRICFNELGILLSQLKV